MCIAILNQPGSFIPKENLKNAWDNNNHGAGIAYIDNDEVCAYHEPHEFDSFYEEYEYIRTISDKPILIHFRIATHGMGHDMLHPHDVTTGRVSLIHNGVISGLGNNDISDTREFANMLSKFYPDNVQFVDHPGIKAFILHALGRTNKVVLLDWTGDYRIVNAHLGHYDNDGNWFSNNSYKQVNSYIWAGNTKVYKKKSPASWNKPTTLFDIPTFSDSDNEALEAWEKEEEQRIKEEALLWRDDDAEI